MKNVVKIRANLQCDYNKKGIRRVCWIDSVFSRGVIGLSSPPRIDSLDFCDCFINRGYKNGLNIMI